MKPAKTGVISAMIDASCEVIGAKFSKIDGKSVQTSAITIGTNSHEIGGSCVTIGLTSDETSATCAGTVGTTGMISVGNLSKRGETLWKITG